jgi:hypothetical protein
MGRESSAAEKMIGDFAPKPVELTDRVLFGDVWKRQELSMRDRSLVTVAALIALNRPDQLRSQLGKAVDNGVRKAGADRGHHPSGVVCGLAQRHERDLARERVTCREGRPRVTESTSRVR